jgi:putative ABC transport system permease protein
MRAGNLLYFYRVRLRARWVQELFALAGIAVGVALLFAAQIANTSLTGSVEQLVSGTVGRADLQIVARDPHGFDESVLERVRELDGVRVAAPLLELRANASGPGGRRPLTILASDRTLTHLGGALLRRFRSADLPEDDVIGLPRPIAQAVGATIGDQVKLEIGAETARAPLGTDLTERDIGPLVHSPLALARLEHAQELGGMPGRITRVVVEPAPGREADVRRELEAIAADRMNVRSSHFDVEVFRQAAMPSNQSTSLFALISALVGFLFAFNAMLLTLSERRRLIADLRIDGYSPLAVLQVVLFDALMLGVAASAIGLVLGDLLSRELFDDTPAYLSFAFPVGEQRIVRPESVAIAVAGGIGATTLAALLPLLGLARRRPVAGDSGSDRVAARWAGRMFGAGLVALAGSTAVLLAAPAAAVLGTVLLVVALMLLLPGTLAGVLKVAELVLRRVRSAVPLISLGELRSMSARSIAVSATGALAVFGAVAIQGARGDLQRGLDRSARDVNAIADVWASPAGETNAFATIPIRRTSTAEVEAVPGVREVRAYRAGLLDIGDRRVWVMAPPRGASGAVPPTQLRDGDVDEAAARLRAGGWAVVSEAVADELGLSLGERFSLPAPRRSEFRVAATSTNVGWAPGAVILNADDYRRAWGSGAATAYNVMLEPGVDPDSARAGVERALGADPAVAVETAAQREDRHRTASRQGLARLTQLAALVLVAAVLAMAAATGGMVWQRRARLASLKLDGFDDMTVWRALLTESGLLLGTGCLLGALVGLYGQQLLDRALSTVTGFPIVPSVGIDVAIGSFALVTAVAVAIAALPGYLAARVPPAAALQE